MTDELILSIVFPAILFIISFMGMIKTDWRNKAANAFFVVGQHAKTKEERIWGYRNSLLASNEKAEKFYVIANIENFMQEKPLTPFLISNGVAHHKIPCIFVDYYIPSRYSDFSSWQQRKFTQAVYSFKDGKDTCSGQFKDAISRLELKEDVLVLFMPCSSKGKYMARFARLAKALSFVDGLNPQLFSVTYLNERDSKHLSTDRDNITASSNIVVNSDIIGKKAILVDDVITTGKSLREHIKELAMFNVEIVGAVFLAKTIQYPSSLSSIKRKARKEEPNWFRDKYL